MTTTPFGDRLKREREMRGVSLEEVAHATRISTRYLEALETERWSELPGGVFNRGFIRTISKFLGLDEADLLGEYADATKNLPVAPVRTGEEEDLPDRRWIPATALLILTVMLIAGAWFAYRHFGHRFLAWLNPHSASAAPVSQPVAAAPRPAAPSPIVPGDAAAASETSAPAILELKVEAGKPAQVKIVADGQPVYSGIIEAGETQRYQARDSFDVSASDSAAVLLELNGLTMAPLGAPGQSGSVTLSRKDLKGAAGGPH